ncbi:MAG: TraB/GumN family protein [Sterolibacteriaceae bacterium]|nr:TraB/GumN family protein [Candidatus Methylophosphatis haderslevensis]
MRRNRGKDIVALETIDEQIAAMNDLPEESQLALLRHAEANYERIQQSFAALRDAYLARDLAAIWIFNRDLMAGGEEIEPHNARFLDSLLYRRNQRFAERLMPLLDQGGTFAAFGALHLYGPRGVPALLARRGYTVTRIY